MKKTIIIIKTVCLILLVATGVYALLFGMINMASIDTDKSDAYTRIDAVDLYNDIQKIYVVLGLFFVIASAYFFAGYLERFDANRKNVLEEGIIDNISKYRVLLENGVITQEEFDAKKKELLGL